MHILKAKRISANDSFYVPLERVTSFGVSGGSGAFSIYVTVTGITSPVIVKDGYTSRDDADAALVEFLEGHDVEEIS